VFSLILCMVVFMGRGYFLDPNNIVKFIFYFMIIFFIYL
jgi:hypothetical protein